MHPPEALLTLHKEQALLLGDLAEAPPLRGIQAGRLLYEDVLPGFQSRLGVGVVSGMQCPYVDDVDVLARSALAMSVPP